MKAYGSSHVGKVRQINEDNYYLPKLGETFAVVADGMGGHKAGEIASSMAVKEFTRWLRCAPRPTESTMNYAIHEANRAIYRTAQREPDKSNMGTTLVSLWLDDNRTLLCNVGDSRAYLFRQGCLKQMTRDHSLVAEMVRDGTLTAEEARVHPQRNMITRAVGTMSVVKADIFTADRQDGDVWLLCSDGLSNLVRDEEMESVLRLSASGDERIDTLIGLALARGGNDNITLVIVDCEEAGL